MPSLPSSLALTVVQPSAQILSADHRNNYAAIQTAVNALITALSSGTTGQVLQATSSTAVAWGGGTYTAYTPTWTASGTAPAYGNATVLGRYTQIGKLVHAYGQITFGSTSTFGTGSYTFSLPVNATASLAGTILSIGDIYGLDSSASAFARAVAIVPTASTISLQYPNTYPTGTQSIIGQTAPWTWATSDTLAWTLLYEAA